MNIFFYALWSIMGLLGIKLIFWDAPKYFDKYWHGVLVASLGLGLICLYASFFPAE